MVLDGAKMEYRLHPIVLPEFSHKDHLSLRF